MTISFTVDWISLSITCCEGKHNWPKLADSTFCTNTGLYGLLDKLLSSLNSSEDIIMQGWAYYAVKSYSLANLHVCYIVTVAI